MASRILPRGLKSMSVAGGTSSTRGTTCPRIGRVLIARGRDAADVAIVTTFGPNTLESFKVWTDEIEESKTVSPILNCAIRA